jgi:prophage antirepressor-like protein
MNELQNFNFEGNNVPVQLINNQLMFDAETVIKSVGISQIKNGKVYARFETASKYLSQNVGKGDFITEQQMYKLAIKANNPTAERFQDWVTGEVLPTIRKYGAYLTDQKIEEVLTDPDTIIKLATQLKQERTGRLIAEQQVKEFQPKVSYYDRVLANPSLVTISIIAKDYGMSARQMNALLHDLGVQYKQGSTWLLYARYQQNGWTQSQTTMVKRNDGNEKAVLNTKWTQKGRLGLYELLKRNNVYPMIEKLTA